MAAPRTARRNATCASNELGSGVWHILHSIFNRFEQELELPSLPEMVFPESGLKLTHQSGVGLEFLALDALRRVNPSEDPLKVSMAEEWSRQQ